MPARTVELADEVLLTVKEQTWDLTVADPYKYT